MSAIFGPAGNSEKFYEEKYKSTLQAMKWVADYGLDAYEYSGGNGITGGEKTFTEIGKAAAEQGIRLSLHAPYFISLSSADPEIQAKSLGHIIKSLEAASWLGAGIIVVHPGGAGKDRTAAYGIMRGALGRIEAELEGKYGGIKIALETMGKKGQLGTLEEVVECCAGSSRYVPAVDFGHMNAREGGGIFATRGDYYRVFEYIGEKLGEEYAEHLHCHFSKIAFTSGGEKKHLTFADEEYGPPFEPFMEMLAEHKFSPAVICESDGTMAEDALAMKLYYTKFSETLK